MNAVVFLCLLKDLQPDAYFKKYQIGEDSNNLIMLKDTELVDGRCHEYLVFRKNDEIFKIHHKGINCDHEKINVDNFKSLKKKSTSRILMMDDLIYDPYECYECVGYKMPYIKRRRILDESLDHYLNEASLLSEDVDYVSNELVLLDDLHSGNHIYDGEIKIIDCGKFVDCHIAMPTIIFSNIKYSFHSTIEKILEDNFDKILNEIRVRNHDLINRVLLTTLLRDYIFEVRKEIEEYIGLLMNNEKIKNVIDFVESTKENDMTVKEYVQKITKGLY